MSSYVFTQERFKEALNSVCSVREYGSLTGSPSFAQFLVYVKEGCTRDMPLFEFALGVAPEFGSKVHINMSASMIRRGLELLSDDIKDGSKKQKSAAKKKHTPSRAEVMGLVSTNRQGVSRQVRRLQGRLGPGKSKATVKDKRIKSAVEEFRKKQGKSHLSSNLLYFLGTGFRATDSDTMKIVNQNLGRQSRHRPDRTVKKASEEKSVFTEDEFQQFQKEYFGRTVEEGN